MYLALYKRFTNIQAQKLLLDNENILDRPTHNHYQRKETETSNTFKQKKHIPFTQYNVFQKRFTEKNCNNKRPIQIF